MLHLRLARRVRPRPGADLRRASEDAGVCRSGRLLLLPPGRAPRHVALDNPIPKPVPERRRPAHSAHQARSAGLSAPAIQPAPPARSDLYPPLWYPTSNPDSVPWLAAQGFSTAFSLRLHPSFEAVRADKMAFVEATRPVFAGDLSTKGLRCLNVSFLRNPTSAAFHSSRSRCETSRSVR